MSITTNVPYGFELDAMPLEAFGGVGGHRMKPIPGLLRMHGLQLHGGRARKVVGAVIVIAAAVAIPFAVPAVIAAVGASTAVAAAAVGVATGAVIGASAGAASAAISGGNIGRGALIGGATGAIGGGVAGYAAGPVAATGATAGAPLGTVASAQAAAPTAPTVAGLGGSNIASTSQIAGQVAAGGPSAGLALPGAPGIGTALSGGATGAGIGGTGIQSVMATAPTAATFGGTAATGLGPTIAAAAPGGQLATAPIAGTQAAASDPGFFSRLGTGVSNVGSEIAGRFTDPANIADITLRAAGQLAGSAVAGDGLSAEQQQLVDMEMAQLRDLQENNQQAFNDRLEAATALLGESRYFDPEYFGLQRARQQQIAGGQAKREGTRGLTGEQRRAEERRFDIDTGRNVGTAFDQGYLTGVQGRLQTQQAGLNAMPMPNQYTTDFGATSARLRANEEQRLAAAQQVGGLFGGLTGMSQSRSQG